VLSLVNVNFQQNGEYQLEEIIETSPLLEKLILSEVHIGGDEFIEWEIRAPNLRHITICSNIDYGWNFAALPCLHSAVIDLWEYVSNRGQTQCQRLPHEWGLGKGITKAKSYPAEIVQRDGFEPRTW
jgi:hypothetical protein